MKLKKVLAVLMASAMIMGMSVTTFAATPEENDSVSVADQILNVDKNATITAYQIIDAEYTEDGFTGYKWVAGDKAGEPVTFTQTEDGTDVVEGLTDSYITSIISEGALGELTSKDARTDNLEAGTWLLIVTGSDLDKVYNPMIISVYYTGSGSAGTINSGTVDAEDNWSLATSGAYAKSSDVPVTKTVDDGDQTGENDQVAVGDQVTFTITSTLPSYSQASTPTFVVQDTIQHGLAYVMEGEGDGAKVKLDSITVGETVVDEKNYILEMTNEDGKAGFKITFDGKYLKSIAGATQNRDLRITYKATVTEDAVTNVGQNDVEIDYEHGSSTTTEYFYTVSVDGVIKKTREDGTTGLPGATFTLYDDYTDGNSNEKPEADELCGNEITATTTEEGGYDIEFKGLDPDKTYYLTETAAPDGYSINNTVYTITFENLTEAENGTVTYDVLVDGKKITTITYGQESSTENPFVIKNTALSDLPSTGGIGTTIFTIGGCAIMIGAAGMFFVSRRKENK